MKILFSVLKNSILCFREEWAWIFMLSHSFYREVSIYRFIAAQYVTFINFYFWWNQDSLWCAKIALSEILQHLLYFAHFYFLHLWYCCTITFFTVCFCSALNFLHLQLFAPISQFVLIALARQGCTNCGNLAPFLRGNGERMRKWRGNRERMGKWWGIGLRSTPYYLFISSLSLNFLHQNLSHFVAKC